MDYSEAFKVIGSLSGIGSALVLAYDRLYRSRPLAHLHIHDYSVYLRIKNVIDLTVVVSDFVVAPRIAGIAYTDDLRSTIEAVAERFYPEMAKAGRDFVVIDPLKERILRLVDLDALAECKDTEKISFTAKWKSMGRPWPFPRHLKVTATAGELKALIAAAKARPKPYII